MIAQKAISKEDDWQEWKAAITVKEAWQQAFEKLLRKGAKIHQCTVSLLVRGGRNFTNRFHDRSIGGKKCHIK